MAFMTPSPIRRLLSREIAGLKVSPTVGINDISNQMIKEKRKVYKFGLGQSPFPVPNCMVKALTKSAHKKEYLPSQGLFSLRESVASYHNAKDKTANIENYRTADDIMIGPGSKELIFLLQLSYYGELVLQSPCWVSYKPQAEMIGRNIKIIHSHMQGDWKISPNCLREYLELEGMHKPRILVLNYPSNPTGTAYTNSELEQLAAVSHEYGVIVLSDEIYSSLNYTGQYQSISHFYPEGTIILDGISKWSGAGGWRLGYFVFPKNLRWLLDGMTCCASETYTAVSAPISHAAIAAYDGHFENEEIQEYLSKSREILKYVSKMTVDGLNSYGLKSRQPDGGFYSFVDLKQTKKGKQLSEELMKKDPSSQAIYVDNFFKTALKECGVAVLAGHHFGTLPWSLFFRLSFVDFDGEAALKNLNDKSIYDNVLYGVESIGKYMNT